MDADPRHAAPPIQVLLVDADDRTRESLSGLLRIGRRCIVVGAAGRADTALSLAVTMQPDVILMDPRLPEVDGGLALIAALRSLRPGIRVLVMSWSDSLEHLGLAGEADAFVRKTFRAADLVDAVIAAAAGDPGGRDPGSATPC
jgi:DNA-binding NarL/FixJ family response regulator